MTGMQYLVLAITTRGMAICTSNGRGGHHWYFPDLRKVLNARCHAADAVDSE